MHVIFRRYLPIIPQGPGEFLDGIVDEGGCFIVTENDEYIVSPARIGDPVFSIVETRSFDTSTSGFFVNIDVTLGQKAFVQIDWDDSTPITQNEQNGNTTQTYSHVYTSNGIYNIRVFTSE